MNLKNIKIVEWTHRELSLDFPTSDHVHTLGAAPGEATLILGIMAQLVDQQAQQNYETYFHLSKQNEARWTSPDPPFDPQAVIVVQAGGRNVAEVRLISALEAYRQLMHMRESPGFQAIDEALRGAAMVVDKLPTATKSIIDLCNEGMQKLNDEAVKQVMLSIPLEVAPGKDVNIHFLAKEEAKFGPIWKDPLTLNQQEAKEKAEAERYHEVKGSLPRIAVILRCYQRREVK